MNLLVISNLHTASRRMGNTSATCIPAPTPIGSPVAGDMAQRLDDIAVR
ncbi:hypothetical protein [Nonomuraea sp. NPDC049695]